MLLLTFQNASDEPGHFPKGTNFRLTVGALWHPIDHRPIPDHNCAFSRHHGRHYPEISIVGERCVAFRNARNLSTVYYQMALLSLTDTAFRVNDLVVAHKDGQTAVWYGHVRSMAWGSTRVINASAGSVHLDASQAVRRALVKIASGGSNGLRR